MSEVPIQLSSDNSNIVTARFFHEGFLYLLAINSDDSKNTHLNFTNFGSYLKYQHLSPSGYTDSLGWLEIDDTLDLSLEPMSVEVIKFADPNSVQYTANVASELEICDLGLSTVKRGIAGSFYFDGTESSVVNWSFDLNGYEYDDVTVEVWAERSYFYHSDNPGAPVFSFTVKEMNDGLINFFYNGSQDVPLAAARLVSPTGVASEWRPMNIMELDSSTGYLIYGDASGDGGGGGFSTGTGGNGAGGDDNIVGTRGDDVIFGDGSGGGEGPVAGSGRSGGRAGLGGGGDDVIYGGTGNDIIFGDGFAGTENFSDSIFHVGMPGGYGGGGAGGGNPTRSIGGGAGGGGDYQVALPSFNPDYENNPQAGESSTVGWFLPGLQPNSANNYLFAGAGRGVTAAGPLSPSEQIVAHVEEDIYTKVLSDLMGNTDDKRIFEQVMGDGNDYIDGGEGKDWIMAGYGSDIIRGGLGNDVMWGRGGSVIGDDRVLGDNDIFLWLDGDVAPGKIDTIMDFEVWNGVSGDRLDIGGILVDFDNSTEDLADWVSIHHADDINGIDSSSELVIKLDPINFPGDVLEIKLVDVDLTSFTVSDLASAGVFIFDGSTVEQLNSMSVMH